MKFFVLLVLLASACQIKCDLLAGLEHHGGHHDHDHDHDHDDLDDLHDHPDHDDLHDHSDLDDHFDSQEDGSDLENQLLREIQQFLPHKEHGAFPVQPSNEPIDFGHSFDDQNQLNVGGFNNQNQLGAEGFSNQNQFGLQDFNNQNQFGLDGFNNQNQQDVGIPLLPPTHGLDNFLPRPDSFPVSLPERTENNILPQRQEQQRPSPHQQPTFGIAPVPERNIPRNQVIQRPVSIEAFDDEDDVLDLDIPDALSSSPFSLDSAQDDYDEISSNFIGGQGRQLDAGQQAPLAPNSFSLFDGDYPRYDIVPATSFQCGDQLHGGYYADTEAGCQVFHICLDGSLMGSFLCPNGTLFNQALFVCDWWFNVDCSIAPQSYELNARIGVVPGSEEAFS